MTFLFVHALPGFCLAQWHLRAEVGSTLGSRWRFRSIRVPADGIPLNDRFLRSVRLLQPQAVGFSCHYWSIGAFLELARLVKDVCPSSRVILGGPQVHSRSYASQLLEEHSHVDYIVHARSPMVLTGVLRHIAGEIPAEHVPFCTWRHHEGVRQNGDTGCERFDPTVFTADNELLVSDIQSLNEVSFETITGCDASCAYCVYRTEKLRLRDDTAVGKELELLCALQPQVIRICDSNFGGTRQRAKSLLRLLSRCNRASVVMVYPRLSHIDDEYIALLRQAGAQPISIGIQSTNTSALAQASRVDNMRWLPQIRALLHAFPDTPADTIVGLPGDSVEGVRKTLEDIIDAGFRQVNQSVLRLFPGTTFYEDYGRSPAVSVNPVDCGIVGTSDFQPRTWSSLERLMAAAEVYTHCRDLQQCALPGGMRRSRVIEFLDSLDSAVLYELNCVWTREGTRWTRERRDQILSMLRTVPPDYAPFTKGVLSSLQ